MHRRSFLGLLGSVIAVVKWPLRQLPIVRKSRPNITTRVHVRSADGLVEVVYTTRDMSMRPGDALNVNLSGIGPFSGTVTSTATLIPKE